MMDLQTGGRKTSLFLRSLENLSLLILASVPEKDYVALVPVMPRPSFLRLLTKLGKEYRRRKDRSHVSYPKA